MSDLEIVSRAAGNGMTLNDYDVRVVPEPQTYALLLLGVSGMVALRRWRKS